MKRTFKIAHLSAMGAALATGMLAALAFAQTPPSSPPDSTKPRPPAHSPNNAPPTTTPPTAPPQQPGQPMPGNSAAGYIAAPQGSETLATNLCSNCVQLFETADFKGTESTLNAVITGFPAGAVNELPKGLNDALSAVRWNLDPGVVVVFYEDGTGKGEQLILWGKGQMPALSKADFNDKASRWAWYDVGGGVESRSAGSMALPHGAEVSATTVPADTLQLFLDKNFKNNMHQVSPVSAQKAGELHSLPAGLGDSLTSARWNLPEGVIVMFYQDANGKKQQVAIWGAGQLADLDVWDFNDKASRWSWAYVGAPKPGMSVPSPNNPTPNQPRPGEPGVLHP